MLDPKLAEPGSPEELLLQRIDPARIPRHVALIMDGNGRWARQRRLPRVAGHRAGVEAVRETVEVAARLGIGTLTLYAFSNENWKRPPREVAILMRLLRDYLRREVRQLERNNIRLSAIGRLDDLPRAVRVDLDWAREATARCSGLELCLALSYSGRAEIVDACRAIVRAGLAPEAIEAETITRHLYAPAQPPPDLLIRTSGEQRVSNFLLWQIAYAELWITETLWPDFRRRHLFEALADYQQRERRYGGLAAVADPLARDALSARG